MSKHRNAVAIQVFDLPQGRDAQRFSLLKEQRLIYRLALGQPNQEDLIDVLVGGGPRIREVLKSLALNLSAFASEHDQHKSVATPLAA